jgi:hypothetical protein
LATVPVSTEEIGKERQKVTGRTKRWLCRAADQFEMTNAREVVFSTVWRRGGKLAGEYPGSSDWLRRK